MSNVADLTLERCISEIEWKKLLKDPRIRSEDRPLFGGLVQQYRHLRRPPKINYRKLRADLSQAIKAEKEASEWLRRTVANYVLFKAITSTVDFVQVQGLLTSMNIHDEMKTQLQNKERLLRIYDIALERLGERARC